MKGSMNALGRLGTLERKGLIEEWESAFGSAPPPNISQDMMHLSLSWELQAKSSRSQVRALKTTVKKLLKTSAKVTDNLGPSTSSSLPQSTPQSMTLPLRAPLIKPSLCAGTRLSRDWQGRTYIVDVLDKGFAYDGKLYASLSPIAKTITGSHRSGPHFFGTSK